MYVRIVINESKCSRRLELSKKVVIQASGGIESTTMLALAVSTHGKENVLPIAFDTGSIFWKHRDSIAVKRVCTDLQIQNNLYICRMPNPDDFEYNRDGQYQDVGFIPGYKMMFNTAALSWAQRKGAEEVWIGNMADNVYPDESKDFITGLVDLFNRTYTSPEGVPAVKLVEPFKDASKGAVIKKAMELGVNLADTVSCGEERLAGGYNCGICPWCLKRRYGFVEALVSDPTMYFFHSTYEFVHCFKKFIDERRAETNNT